MVNLKKRGKTQETFYSSAKPWQGSGTNQSRTALNSISLRVEFLSNTKEIDGTESFGIKLEKYAL